MLNRQRSYAGDFEWSIDGRDAAKDFNSLGTEKGEPPHIRALGSLFTNDFDIKFEGFEQNYQLYKPIPTDSIQTSYFTETESRSTDNDFHVDGREIVSLAHKVISTHADSYSAPAGEYEKQYLKNDLAINIDAQVSRTDHSFFRVREEELRDAPPDQTVHLRLERICARLAAPDQFSSKQPEPIVWTEYKQWTLCLVKKTDRYIQFELRQKGEKRCLTLFDEEAYFALVALIDCSENPRELIFELSNLSSVLVRADCSVIAQNLRLLLELKKTKARLTRHKSSESTGAHLAKDAGF